MPDQDRDKARRTATSIISRERRKQLDRFPERFDDERLGTDLLDFVAILTQYAGRIAEQGVQQSSGRTVDWTAVAVSSAKCGAVATAMLESLIATGKVKPTEVKI